MAYAALSFTAGEVPTLTKWNQLWENDARLADGTALANASILTRHLAAAAVTSSNIDFTTLFTGGTAQSGKITFGNLKIQWGFVTLASIPAGGNTAVPITFPTAFANIPNMMVSYSATGGFYTNGAVFLGGASAVTATGANIGFQSYAGSPNAITGISIYWMAIGV